MKSIVLLAATAIMSCSLAFAQEQKPAAAEAAKPAAAPAATQETAKPKPVAKASKSAVGTKRARRDEDARHCLGRPSNTEIIKCSEAYL
jgi:hypothetical protein